MVLSVSIVTRILYGDPEMNFIVAVTFVQRAVDVSAAKATRRRLKNQPDRPNRVLRLQVLKADKKQMAKDVLFVAHPPVSPAAVSIVHTSDPQLKDDVAFNSDGDASIVNREALAEAAVVD